MSRDSILRDSRYALNTESGYNLCRTSSLTNLDNLNIVRPIISDKICHMTIIKVAGNSFQYFSRLRV